MSQGRIYFPQDNPWWKTRVEGQLFVWQGLNDEPDDIVDMVSLGAHYVDWSAFDSRELSNVRPTNKEERFISKPGMSIVETVDMDLPCYF